jgi:hypothetical protein
VSAVAVNRVTILYLASATQPFYFLITTCTSTSVTIQLLKIIET